MKLTLLTWKLLYSSKECKISDDRDYIILFIQNPSIPPTHKEFLLNGWMSIYMHRYMDEWIQEFSEYF